jgi:hypothetical protein
MPTTTASTAKVTHAIVAARVVITTSEASRVTELSAKSRTSEVAINADFAPTELCIPARVANQTPIEATTTNKR